MSEETKIRITGGSVAITFDGEGPHQAGATTVISSVYPGRAVVSDDPVTSSLPGRTPIISGYLRTSSFDVQGNLNYRRLPERKSYDRWLMGEALRSELGFEVTDEDGAPIVDPYADPPSWTQDQVGKNQAFVISEFSSSFETNLNVYASGPFSLEETAVPASGTSYYSKSSKYITKSYKLSASVVLDTDPAYSGTGWHFETDMGFAFSSSMDNPARFKIDVPDHGRLIDIKVWVEFMHNSGVDRDDGPFGGTDGMPSYDHNDPDWAGGPLATFFLALKPPNTSRRFNALPWENDKRVVDAFGVLAGQGTQSSKAFGVGFWGATYPLWFGRSGSSYSWDQELSTWQNNRHMRTIFWDSSPNNNPYRLDPTYRNGPDPLIREDVGSEEPTTLRHDLSELASTPPNQFNLYFRDLRGADRPWIGDPDDQTVAGVVAGVNDGEGSPPNGWLSVSVGDSGSVVADENEWPTTGSNYGPETITPALPMLPKIFGRAITPNEFQRSSFNESGESLDFHGFRPGMRGTEINGAWELWAVCNNSAGAGDITGIVGTLKDGYEGLSWAPPHNIKAWFRQFRIELTYEPGHKPSFSSVNQIRFNNNSSGKRFKTEKEKDSLGNRLTIVSGSTWATLNVQGTTFYTASFDYAGTRLGGAFEAEIFEAVQDQPYTTVGLTDLTGASDFAVFSQLTGSMADEYGPNPHWFIGFESEFGTPYIPLSSGSGEEPTFDLYTDASENMRTLTDVLSPKPLVTRALTLRSVLAGKSVTKLTRDTMSDSITEDDE